MLNRFIGIGRLVRDPEAKYIPSGVPVTTFTIAIDRPQSSEARQQGKDKETDFVDCVAWRQTAEFAANYLQKGRLVAVEGVLNIRSYVTQEGQQRKAAEIKVDNVRPLDRRPDEAATDNETGQGNSAPAPGNGGNQRPPAPGSRPPARNQPPPSGYDDNDDLTDPFAGDE